MRTRLIAAAAALLTIGPVALISAPADGATRHLPHTNCPVFPADNFWHADISKLPVNARSDQWLSHMSPGTKLHPDFGPAYGAAPVDYGIPITVVGGKHAKVRVHFTYASESYKRGYPLGGDTKIEGGRSSDGDRHAIVINKKTCRLYETFATRQTSTGKWHAGSGASWKLTKNKLRPSGWTSADAAGLPILPGLLRFGEVRKGNVDHAIRFTTDVTDRRHIWPARHDAGSVSSQAYPPMGARFRLKASFPISSYRADTQTVLRAMKRYGLVLADNGSPWFFQGARDSRWTSGLLDQLKSIPASAFVAVDTSSLEISANSAAAH
jgi:hypothetical protein